MAEYVPRDKIVVGLYPTTTIVLVHLGRNDFKLDVVASNINSPSRIAIMANDEYVS